MKRAKTYIFDAIVNLIAQVVLFLIGAFMWLDIPRIIIWAVAAAGFAAFLSVMERGAELRRGADFRSYMLFTVLPVNVIALIVAVICGVIEYNRWVSGALLYVYTPLYPVGIAVGTAWITLAFTAINRLTRQNA